MSWRYVFSLYVRASTALVVVGVAGALGSALGHASDAGASPDSAVTRAAGNGSAAPTPAAKVEAFDAADSSAIVRRWGIRIESLRVTLHESHVASAAFEGPVPQAAPMPLQSA